MTEQNEDFVEIVDTHEVYGGWSKMLIATLRLPDGRTIKREIEDHGEAVCVLPYHPVRKTAVLVRQSRVPVLYARGQQQLLEAVAGVIEDVDAATCAHREVMEEALLKLDALEPVFMAFTMPGLSTEYMHFFLPTYSGEPRPETRGGVDDDEFTVAIEIELAELARMADENRLPDVKTLLLLQTLRLRRPELFV
jgi:nudix-type nucleoside diphosphatase (YffH/AdpP family)